MQINTTVLLTLILLTLMLGASSASGFLGFKLGSDALKGVTTAARVITPNRELKVF
jgi:hypothetical protein